VGFVMCWCVYVWGLECVGFISCVSFGNMCTCIYCVFIVCTVFFLYCFIYVYIFLLFFLLSPNDNSTAVNNNNNNKLIILIILIIIIIIIRKF
jgi:heme/copper-type cytochrome/quinol oxidase subunit 2